MHVKQLDNIKINITVGSQPKLPEQANVEFT